MISTRQATVKTAQGKFGQTMDLGPHTLLADEPREVGGDDLGPSPTEFLLAALGSCTSMTLKVYADHKKIALTRVTVSLSQEHDAATNAHVILRTIHLEGDLTDEQRTRLHEIANKCPVHKILSGTIRLETALSS